MSINDFQILLIDDDEDDYVHIRSLFAEMDRSKYQLTWRPTYQDGLTALREQQFDACLLDYRLGAKTGLELLREVHKFGLRCPMIILTGEADFDLDLQAMQIGAADYLIKGQLTAPLLERSIRYSMKQALDMEELKESKAQILQQDRLASLGLLASSLAHEIGTPLAIIRGRAELAEGKAEIDSGLKKDMQIITTQIDRITKLVNSLLHLARGSEADHAAAVNLSHVAGDVVNLVQHEFDRKGIRFQYSSAGDFTVKAEPGPLGQVLLNLIINSVHAIEEAKAQGRAEGHEIALLVEKKSDFVRILIRDTGCGIPEENFSHIFKAFFTTKDIGQGTGLGLATSYKLVQSWGGSISVESQPGVGTTFTIDLPPA